MISAGSGEENQTTTACVGRCDFGYRMDCPRGKRVVPRDLTYYAKVTAAKCPAIKQNIEVICQSSGECCGYTASNCCQPFSYSIVFEVFNNCSGYQNCGWFKAESVDFETHCDYREQSNYVSATDSCIPGNCLQLMKFYNFSYNLNGKLSSFHLKWYYVLIIYHIMGNLYFSSMSFKFYFFILKVCLYKVNK